MEIILSNDINEIRQLISQGFCPVECSIGGESIVDALEMDHHGEMSYQENEFSLIDQHITIYNDNLILQRNLFNIL